VPFITGGRRKLSYLHLLKQPDYPIYCVLLPAQLSLFRVESNRKLPRGERALEISEWIATTFSVVSFAVVFWELWQGRKQRRTDALIVHLHVYGQIQ